MSDTQPEEMTESWTLACGDVMPGCVAPTADGDDVEPVPAAGEDHGGDQIDADIRAGALEAAKFA